jgi:transposase
MKDGIRKSRLSWHKQERLNEHFVSGSTARCSACLVDVNKTLMPIIERKVVPDSIVYSDCWKGYNVLDVSDFKHSRINHSKLFANKHHRINGIENFWSQAKRHMRKFNGVPKQYFGLFLKECEFRFNYGTPKQQIAILKKWCYKSS